MTASKLAGLKQVFASDEWPTFHGLECAEQTATVRLEVPTALRWLRGHFPGQAVLPGIVQTHWAALIGRHLYPTEGTFRHIDNLKFHHVILPGAQISLTLSAQKDSRVLTFAYRQQKTRCSEGKLVFSGPPNG